MQAFGLIYLEIPALVDDLETLRQQVMRRLQRLHPHQFSCFEVGCCDIGIALQQPTDAENIQALAQLLIDRIARLAFRCGEIACYLDDLKVGIALSSQPVEVDLLTEQSRSAIVPGRPMGGQQIFMFDPNRQERHITAPEIRQAIEENQLFLMYQPIYQTDSLQLAGAEVLVRWRHPQHGNLPPDAFLPIAETAGLMAWVDEWVYRTVDRQRLDWERLRRTADQPLALHVNLSPATIGRLPFLELARQYNPSPLTQITLEITEGGLTGSARSQVVNYLDSLRSIGFKIEIDDFGAGFSGLTRLSEFPVDGIKLDRALTVLSDRNRSICESVVELAQKLGISIVAEGIETLTQIEWMRSIGVPFLQGFGLSRPLVKTAFELALML